MAHVRGEVTDYEIRRFRPRDRAGFLSLYEAVWGRAKGRAWFDWRFEANPYAERVEIVVAEHRGTVVGAEPMLAFPLATDRGAITARQPVDWIVHPDHRRQGIFSEMTTFLLERYDDADLLFNFPNDALRPGLEQFDWTVAGEVSMSYRVQRPSFLLSLSGSGGALEGVLSTTLDAGANAAVALLDRVGTPPSDVTVERHSDVPVETLADLYASTVPERIHVPRDEAFLDWRFGNPRWDTTTYIALRDGTPVGSVVAATEQYGTCVRTHLLDVQPMDGFGSGTSPDVFEALLSAVVTDHRSVDVLRAPTMGSSGLLRRYGFLPDSAFPLSRVVDPSTHVVRPLWDAEHGAPTTDREFDVDGSGLLDSEAWILLPADLDIG